MSKAPVFSYGFRPFFLGGALFAGMAIPAWVLILAEVGDATLLASARDWHVHEMVFGFLPAVMTGFLLTAIPNWTDRPPVSGKELIILFALWVAGRLVMVIAWSAPLLSAIIDGAFLVVVAGLVWREIAVGRGWDRAPIGVLISLYAAANVVFHVLALNGSETDVSIRMALTLVIVLLALIGGRVTPTFTEEFLTAQGKTGQSTQFSRFDGVSILLVVIAGVAWIVQPQVTATGWILVIAGIANLGRMSRWHGWATWREPLVLVLHLGYGWFAISLVILGGAIVGMGLPKEDAVHALTAGAVGVMTLAVMTRASLGHTGRPRHAGPMTILIYTLVNVGALLRVFTPIANVPTTLMLGLAAVGWSGAYLLFAFVYGPFLLRPSLDE